MDECFKLLGLSALNEGVWCGATALPFKKENVLSSENPSTATRLAEVSTGDVSDYQKLMQQAQTAVQIWKNTPAPKRGELVRLIGEALRCQQASLGRLIALESGKSLQEGLGEVQEMIDMADFAVGQSRMLYGCTMHSERPQHRLYEQWHPYGVVGVITSFNFPMAVWAWNAFLAIIAGNVVLWKPSAKTPLCAVAIQKLCAAVLQKHHYPDICYLWIPASHAIAESFIDDTRIPLISFTGSTHVGRYIAQRVAQRLGKSLLELGGNNAVIVDETASLALAIPAITFGAVGTAGQRCTTTRRLFVHNSLYQKTVAALIKAYRSVRIGSPLDPLNHMGPLIDAQAVATYQQAITEIRQAGATVVFGGEVLAMSGHFVQPTLVVDLSPEAAIVKRETFAPILYMMPYTDFEEVIQQQNAVPQGLSSALFTQSLPHAERFLSAMGSDCGIANINLGTSGAEIGGAFGGEKETGGGREAGSDAWRAYMRRQTNTINWGTSLPLAQGIQFEL